MRTIADILTDAASVLAEAGVAEPRREASSLLAFVLGKDRTFIIAHPEYVPTAEEERRFADAVARRERREPLQYITGRQEFYGLDFIVTPDVLIPRPETEMVVEHAVELLSNKDPRFCEVGVGSGCISVSILKQLPSSTAVGLDISEAAIAVARRNSQMHAVDGRLELRESDVFSVLTDEKFDLIASNPPYIPLREFESVQAEVRDFEPRVALTDDADGLSIIRRIVNGSPKFLRPGGWLLMEIGFQEADDVRELLSQGPWVNTRIADDLQGIPRCVITEYSGS
jgi:release factor glutamine methyltransferase